MPISFIFYSQPKAVKTYVLLRYAALAIVLLLIMIVGIFPVYYFISPGPAGILRSKSPQLLESLLWNAAFYGHIIFGGIALLTGWPQFFTKLRQRRVSLHRRLGMVYITTVWISGLCALSLAPFSNGGMMASAGFTGLSLTWLISTSAALAAIKKGSIVQHKNRMIYSYAATFSAVTLRLWMPLLMTVLRDFNLAYNIVAWLCWVPNMLVAYGLVHWRERRILQAK